MGEGLITVKDNITELTKEIKLITTLQPFTTEIDGKNDFTVYFYEGSEKDIKIYTGNGDYEIVIGDQNVVTASLVDEKTIKLIPQKLGESSLTIKDKLSGKEVTTKIVVIELQQLIVFSQKKVTVNVGLNETIRIVENKSGRSTWYLKFEPIDPTIALADEWNNELTIIGKKPGKTTILVRDYFDDSIIYGSLAIEVI